MVASRGPILVTGASGYIGSWLVCRLLERGYTVRATVRKPDDTSSTQHFLDGLPMHLRENLQIFKADIDVEGDFDAPVNGCEGVFHLASPTKVIIEDYKRDMVDPAVNGTLNVLKSCIKAGTVKRFVNTSSIAATLAPRPVVDESIWTDADSIIKSRHFLSWEYAASKVLAEKAATEFATEHNLDLVNINPSLVLGPFTVSYIPGSIFVCLQHLIQGDTIIPLGLTKIPCVHIEDLCRAFIFLYENLDAKGRYICNSDNILLTTMANIIRSHHPDVRLNFKGSNNEDDQADASGIGIVSPHYFDSSKLKKLGFEYHHSTEDMIEETVACCKRKGLLQPLLV